jgi:signal transduction histidine kinase
MTAPGTEAPGPGGPAVPRAVDAVPSDAARCPSGGWPVAVRRRTLVSMVTTDPPTEALPRPDLPRPDLPRVPAPPAFHDRRGAFRRSEDRTVHEERALLARALDILAGPGGADEQLAGILAMVARVVGARRAALVVDEPIRRVTVAISSAEAEDAGHALAAWLDAHAPRSAARRAAALAAPVGVVRARREAMAARAHGGSETDATYFLVPVSGAGGAHLGVELPPGADTAAVTARLPASTYRHVLVALALASSRAADERERSELRARDAERTRFVSMVAHELRTPLTGLGGYLDLLLDGRVTDAGVEREFLERGRRITEGMAELVGDLLEMSSIEAGSLGLKIAPFSLAEACAHVLDGLEPIADTAGLRLVRALPPRLRPATGDRRRVEQIVTNLVANAIKYTPHGGLVELEAHAGAAAAFVVVRDDGPGITIEDRARIFEPFVRLAGHERITGTGLGLPIARDLARAMRGDLGAVSVLGIGSSFVLALPGAADVDGGAVATALAAVLEAEEIALEEQAVLVALRGPARPAIHARHRDDTRISRPDPESTGGGSAT